MTPRGGVHRRRSGEQPCFEGDASRPEVSVAEPRIVRAHDLAGDKDVEQSAGRCLQPGDDASPPVAVMGNGERDGCQARGDERPFALDEGDIEVTVRIVLELGEEPEDERALRLSPPTARDRPSCDGLGDTRQGAAAAHAGELPFGQPRPELLS